MIWPSSSDWVGGTNNTHQAFSVTSLVSLIGAVVLPKIINRTATILLIDSN